MQRLQIATTLRHFENLLRGVDVNEMGTRLRLSHMMAGGNPPVRPGTGDIVISRYEDTDDLYVKVIGEGGICAVIDRFNTSDHLGHVLNRLEQQLQEAVRDFKGD